VTTFKAALFNSRLSLRKRDSANNTIFSMRLVIITDRIFQRFCIDSPKVR